MALPEPLELVCSDLALGVDQVVGHGWRVLIPILNPSDVALLVLSQLHLSPILDSWFVWVLWDGLWLWKEGANVVRPILDWSLLVGCDLVAGNWFQVGCTLEWTLLLIELLSVSQRGPLVGWAWWRGVLVATLRWVIPLLLWSRVFIRWRFELV